MLPRLILCLLYCIDQSFWEWEAKRSSSSSYYEPWSRKLKPATTPAHHWSESVRQFESFFQPSRSTNAAAIRSSTACPAAWKWFVRQFESLLQPRAGAPSGECLSIALISYSIDFSTPNSWFHNRTIFSGAYSIENRFWKFLQ